MKQTPESIEVESARLRSQLIEVGADIRHRADPKVIVETAKTSFKRRAEGAPSFLKENATPIGLVMLGGAFGAVATGLFSRTPRGPSPSAANSSNAKVVVKSPSSAGMAPPRAKSTAKAAVLSALGVGLGYVAGMFVPETPAEERLLAEPKAILRERLDAFLDDHTRGVKSAAANLFGVSRLSATTLIGLAIVAELLGPSQQASKSGRQ